MALGPRSLANVCRLLDRPFFLGRLAVLNDLLTATQLDECLDEQRRSPEKRPLGAVLVAKGYLSADQLTGLLRQQKEIEDLDARGTLPVPMEAVVRIVGRYVLTEQLGAGGAGIVWKAWDTRLRRWVALKEPRLADPALRERFLREAQATARLSHPGVVTLYDVGQVHGQVYVVMELVEGSPLDEVLRARPPEVRTLLELLRRVALAVHHAHAHGIIHRDLKPGNVLVTLGGEPKVADFGLAHVSDADTALTRTGAALGTPGYMAPEQVDGRGKAVTPRTDVYALGGILYEILTGRPPHTGESIAEVFAKILSHDPPGPRRVVPGTPAELETIALKALDKDPDRRYPTAEAFAEDLRRYLSGEPILARPPGAVTRLCRRIRKRGLAVSLGATIVAGLLATGLLWRSGRGDREARVQTLREMARLVLEAALKFRRRGHNALMREYLPELERAYRNAADAAPDLAEPDYLMGRMHRALMEDATALRYQEDALRKDPNFAPALYERAVLTSREYGAERYRALEILRTSPAGSVTLEVVSRLPPPGLQQLDRARPRLAELRDRVVADCLALERAGIEEGKLLAARGVLLYHQGEPAKAQAVLEEAVRRSPEAEEAREALALAIAEQPARGNSEREQRRRAAEAVYSEGLARDRGYLPYLMGRGETRIALANNRWDSGQDPLPAYEGAIQDFTDAIALDPRAALPLSRRAGVHSLRGEYREDRGADPTADYDRAEADLTAAIELQPSSYVGWMTRGRVRRQRGTWRASRGLSPLEDYGRAEEDAVTADRLSPKHAGVRVNLGHLRLKRAAWRRENGEDPEADLRKAEDDLSEAIKRNVVGTSAWAHRGCVLAHRAAWRGSRGEDPEPDFEAGEKELSYALKLDPEAIMALEFRAFLRTERAGWRAAVGGDAGPAFEGAEADLAEMLKVYGGYSVPWMMRGRLAHRRALWRKARVVDPTADLARAEADLSEALRLNPGYAEAWAERAAVKAARGDPPGARADGQRAVALNPKLAPALERILAPAREKSGSPR